MRHRMIRMMKITAVCMFILTAACSTTPRADLEAEFLNRKIEQLAEKLIDVTDTDRAGTVAVLYFLGPDGRVTALGEHLSDKLSVRLYRSRAFKQMLERRQIRQVISAKTEELSGYFDLDTVHVYGQMIGADSLLVGTIEDLGPSVDLTAKVVSSETGRILGMADQNIAKRRIVHELIRPLNGDLTIHTNPSVEGTAVIGDRRVIIRNGAAFLPEFPYGRCCISISAEGYETVQDTLSFYSGRESIRFDLKQKKYTVSFHIRPTDAALRVDGQQYALDSEGFLQVGDLSPREHDYIITANGYSMETGRFNPLERTVIATELQTSDPFYHVRDKLFAKVKEAQKQQAFGIELWTEKNVYRLGDKLTVFFRASRDCYLNLISVNSQGEITLLFPNRYHQGNRIRAGRTYGIPDETYPFEFQAQPPTGRDRIYALASTRPLNIFDTDFSSSSFASLTRGASPAAGVRGIGVNIKSARLEAAADIAIEVLP